MKMRFVLVLILVLVGLLLVGPRPASAHSGYWRNTGNALNVRSGPGGAYEVIGRIESWGLIKAYGHSGNWLKGKVLATGQVGWMWRWNFHASSYMPPDGGSASGSASGLTLCYDTSFNWTACAPEWIAEIIYAAAHAYGIGPFWLMSIAACESGFDPNAWAYSPPDNVYGLFQFRPSTMAWIYPGGNVWSVSDSSYAAAKLLTIDPAQFDCSWRIGYI